MVGYLPTLRAMCGMTQMQLGNKMGVSRQTVAAIENQKRPMTWSMYLAFFCVFEQYPDTNKLMESFGVFDKSFVKMQL